MNHANAITHCSNKGKGFRLPNIYELRTIISLNTRNSKDAFSQHPEINTNRFNYNYWSSTTNAKTSSIAWFVDFNSGGVSYSGKTNFYYRVVCLQD